MPGRCRHARSALAAAGAALACGDPGDIEVAFAPPSAARETVPMFARAPAHAFVNIDIVDGSASETGEGGGASGGERACPIHFSSSLGKPCSALDTDDPICVPVREGEDASVSCSVRPLVEVPDVYDVTLTLRNEFLPELSVIGVLGARSAARVALDVTTPDGARLDAYCSPEVLDIRPGATRFRLERCSPRIADESAPGCDVTLVAGFEGCGG
jgi:hypothetical protein